MYLFYSPDLTLPLYTLPEEESKHAVRVLRMSVGDPLNITNGRGTMYQARVVDPNPKRCSVEIVSSEEQFEKRDYELCMGVAPTKNIERFEWFLEKATEIGIDRIVPLRCDHSVRETVKLERAEKVVISAVKQSLKAYKPVLEEMTAFRKFVTQPFDGVKLIAHCDAPVVERKPVVDTILKGERVLILIGPEGDFSKEEITFAVANGFCEISLGTSRLRTETAALVAVAGVAFINQK